MLAWADDVRRLKVRANADTPEDAVRAREFGAQGIGLCRTEHMFFGDERLPVVQEMIMARDEQGRRTALDRLLPMQQSDFEGIFEAMAGLPGHDPAARSAAARVSARARGGDGESCARGSGSSRRRTRCSARAAAVSGSSARRSTRCRCARSCAQRRPSRSEAGEAPLVEIMHPLVGFAEELRRLRELTDAGRGGGARRRVSLRHDDRAPARVRPRGRDRRVRGLLLVRDERPDADGARLLARRRRRASS